VLLSVGVVVGGCRSVCCGTFRVVAALCAVLRQRSLHSLCGSLSPFEGCRGVPCLELCPRLTLCFEPGAGMGKKAKRTAQEVSEPTVVDAPESFSVASLLAKAGEGGVLGDARPVEPEAPLARVGLADEAAEVGDDDWEGDWEIEDTLPGKGALRSILTLRQRLEDQNDWIAMYASSEDEADGGGDEEEGEEEHVSVPSKKKPKQQKKEEAKPPLPVAAKKKPKQQKKEEAEPPLPVAAKKKPKQQKKEEPARKSKSLRAVATAEADVAATKSFSVGGANQAAGEWKDQEVAAGVSRKEAAKRTRSGEEVAAGVSRKEAAKRPRSGDEAVSEPKRPKAAAPPTEAAKRPARDSFVPEDPSRVVFAGNLPFTCSGEDVRQAFEAQALRVRRVHLETKPSGKPAGFAYVELDRADQVEGVLKGGAGVVVGERKLSFKPFSAEDVWYAGESGKRREHKKKALRATAAQSKGKKGKKPRP
jgi:hypothetical protein